MQGLETIILNLDFIARQISGFRLFYSRMVQSTSILPSNIMFSLKKLLGACGEGNSIMKKYSKSLLYNVNNCLILKPYFSSWFLYIQMYLRYFYMVVTIGIFGGSIFIMIFSIYPMTITISSGS